VKAQLARLPVHHRQADDAVAPLDVLAFGPAEQRRQGIELALDRPVGADRRLVARHEPDPQHLLQVHGTLVAVDHGQALGLQLPSQLFLVAGRFEAEILGHRTRIVPRTAGS
jgi:hypothetical protein